MQNPVPGTTRAHNDGHYASDSGCDILVPEGTPCVAAADGTIVYSEWGHVLTYGHPEDTRNSVLLRLDNPFQYKGRTALWAWYTHLSWVAHHVAESDGQSIHLKAGDPVGKTGLGRGIGHLHFGLIINRAQAGDADWLAPADVADIVFASGAQVAGPPRPIPVVPVVGTVVVTPKPTRHVHMGPQDLHLVASGVGRSLKVYDAAGQVRHRYEALLDGVNGPGWRLKGGDTPPGEYRIGTVEDIPESDAEANAYGPRFISLDDIGGAEAKLGRAGVGIHGGGTGLPNAWSDPRQKLINTLGCVRCHNADVIELANSVRYTQQAGGTVWLTVSWT